MGTNILIIMQICFQHYRTSHETEYVKIAGIEQMSSMQYRHRGVYLPNVNLFLDVLFRKEQSFQNKDDLDNCMNQTTSSLFKRNSFFCLFLHYLTGNSLYPLRSIQKFSFTLFSTLDRSNSSLLSLELSLTLHDFSQCTLLFTLALHFFSTSIF